MYFLITGSFAQKSVNLEPIINTNRTKSIKHYIYFLYYLQSLQQTHIQKDSNQNLYKKRL